MILLEDQVPSGKQEDGRENSGFGKHIAELEKTKLTQKLEKQIGHDQEKKEL